MSNTLRNTLFALLLASALALLPVSAAAQSGVLFVEGDKVGVGVEVPEQDLHVQGQGAQVLVRETSPTTADRFLFVLENEKGGASFRINNLEVASVWEFFGSNAFFINNITNPGIEFQINPDGTVVVNGSAVHVPDYVFAEDYALMPLEELAGFIQENGHLPNVPSAERVAAEGINIQGFQMAMLEKIEELTLYVLDQDRRLKEQEQRIEELRAENARLQDRGPVEVKP